MPSDTYPSRTSSPFCRDSVPAVYHTADKQMRLPQEDGDADGISPYWVKDPKYPQCVYSHNL